MAAMNLYVENIHSPPPPALLVTADSSSTPYLNGYAAIAAAAGRVWLSTPTVPNAELIVAATARTLKT
ncbi:uncharacterized protein FFB20_05976 [Fusarium fujikuroi]|uniref:Uncharacterized protein n=2 Tax=Fusarium fujikuroi TaxID=5127 RepID=S0E4W1_GIBF5|nr:uncharacterized protein FFUJ_05615 [Fusarium fujikuroi IMI 58289]SCN79726.1 uncharacterized protein FFB20_05976 [Fusarium fujikuroi]CCT69710.1 uncharacterized protein FFUJ_05615 [Fusarium fujikuroi IMI 58289]SCN83056.1 uncharacterized protein FFC1_04111 [Fusarium fujikuroi]SCV34569.1 uncharacterized protein FFB14_05036 [Fusarium fujikuroi]SCV36671.1 uncharacterized protein FFFS_05346 [Fusarium fujikuroi]